MTFGFSSKYGYFKFESLAPSEAKTTSYGGMSRDLVPRSGSSAIDKK